MLVVAGAAGIGVLSVGAEVQVFARLDDGRIVAVRQGRWLATAFHPELTPDDRLHRYFLREAAGLSINA